MRIRVGAIEKRVCEACAWSGEAYIRAHEAHICPDCQQPTVNARERIAAHHFIAVDEIPGGMVLENYGPHPVKVYSHTERRALALKNGVELKERFSPMPGTDIDPAGIPNPKGYMDPQTLENAKILLSRSATMRDEEPDHVGNIKLTLGATFNDVLGPAEAQFVRKQLG